MAGNGEGLAVKAVRRALIAVTRDDPAGQVVPVDVLRTRIEALVVAQRQCDHEGVGRQLPALIRDLHTSLTAGTAEQLDGMLALSRSLVAAADKRLSDVDAPLEYATDLATRTGEGNAYWRPSRVQRHPFPAR